MYYMINWPNIISEYFVSSDKLRLIFNDDMQYISILSPCDIVIYYTKTQTKLLHYIRSADSVQHYGNNVALRWKCDNSSIAIATEFGFLLLFSLQFDLSKGSRENILTSNHSVNISCKIADIPSLSLTLTDAVRISQEAATCLSCMRDDMIACTRDGAIQRVKWSGSLLLSEQLLLKDIQFFHDLQHSRASRIVGDQGSVWCTDVHYSSSVGGLVILLSNGRGALLTTPDMQLDAKRVEGVWAEHLKNATCCAVNDKFRVVAFGGKSGEASVYMVDDVTGAFYLSHRLKMTSRDLPAAGLNMTGVVSQLSWSPDGFCLALAWQSHGGFAVWSVFGSLLFSTLDEKARMGLPTDNIHFQNIGWGAEGYTFWCVMAAQCSSLSSSNINAHRHNNGTTGTHTDSTAPNCHLNDVTTMATMTTPHQQQLGMIDEQQRCSRSIVVFNFGKSALVNNPCQSNHNHLVLQFATHLYINETLHNFSSRTSNCSTTSTSSKTSDSMAGFSKQWHTAVLPEVYISRASDSWPLRYVAIDDSGKFVAIAGTYGFSHYSVSTRRWKMFGNETQEREMQVIGGIAWWRDYICLTCYNTSARRDELRVYPRHTKLDNGFCKQVKLACSALLVNVSEARDLVLVYSSDFRIILYRLSLSNTENNKTTSTAAGVAGPAMLQMTNACAIKLLQDIPIGSYLLHPQSVVCITMCSFKADTNVSAGHNKLTHEVISTTITSTPKTSSSTTATQIAVPLTSSTNAVGQQQGTGMPLVSYNNRLMNNGIINDLESLLVNCAGWVYMFQRDSTSNSASSRITLLSPTTVASAVEFMWVADSDSVTCCHNKPTVELQQSLNNDSSHDNTNLCTSSSCCKKLYLSNALWLNCGAQGMRVWLPLVTPSSMTTASTVSSVNMMTVASTGVTSHKAPGFMSKRIMLPFQVDIYTLLVLFEEALLIGATNDFSHHCNVNSGVNTSRHHPTVITVPGHVSTDLLQHEHQKHQSLSMQLSHLPFATVERTNAIYIHHIVKQLLRKNLGVQALHLSRCCRSLPYFHHALELLLHEVLEEEATSKEPIPDPLLPRVVAFIQEFPGEFLHTVSHCARKTEIALWPYLFNVVGNPWDLFDSCLLSSSSNPDDLNTAASYLIILQNTEEHHHKSGTPISSSVNEMSGVRVSLLKSRKCAVRLLEACLLVKRWPLVRDLIRFLKTIDPLEMSPPIVTSLTTAQQLQMVGMITTGTLRSGSMSAPIINPAPESPSATSSLTQQHCNTKFPLTSDPTLILPLTLTTLPPHHGIGEEIDVILAAHARQLLSCHKIKDLAQFAANTDFARHQFISWLQVERDASAKVGNFVQALLRLHDDFCWPLPIYTGGVGATAWCSQDSETLSGNLLPDYPSSAANFSTNPVQHKKSLPGGIIQVDTSPPSTGQPYVYSPLLVDHPDSSDIYLQCATIPNNNISLSHSLLLSSRYLHNGSISNANSTFSDTSSMVSVTSSDMDNFNAATSPCNDYDSQEYLRVLDMMVQKLANKGTARCETQLRYLYHIFQEAECFEWAFLIAVLLRNTLAVVSVLDAACIFSANNESIPSSSNLAAGGFDASISMPTAGFSKLLQQQQASAGIGLAKGSGCGATQRSTSSVSSAKTRLYQGLDALDLWAETDCQGYKAFFFGIKSHFSMMSQQRFTPSTNPNTSTITGSKPSATNQSQNVINKSITTSDTTNIAKSEFQPDQLKHQDTFIEAHNTSHHSHRAGSVPSVPVMPFIGVPAKQPSVNNGLASSRLTAAATKFKSSLPRQHTGSTSSEHTSLQLQSFYNKKDTQYSNDMTSELFLSDVFDATADVTDSGGRGNPSNNTMNSNKLRVAVTSNKLLQNDDCNLPQALLNSFNTNSDTSVIVDNNENNHRYTGVCVIS